MTYTGRFFDRLCVAKKSKIVGTPKMDRQAISPFREKFACLPIRDKGNSTPAFSGWEGTPQ